MKKIEVTKEQMVEAVRSASDSASDSDASVSASVPTHTIRPVPQWQPNVPNESNSVGRGGEEYKNLFCVEVWPDE